MLLILGDMGFVGTHLKKKLNEMEIPFVGYDLLDGQDIRNKQRLEQIFEKEQITEVIHLAALAGVRRSKKYPEDYISTNILGTQNVVDLCNDHGIKHLIFYSSSSVYGNKKGVPVKETDSKEPLSLYGITKLAGEKIVNNAEIRTTIVRPFTIYGENGRKDGVIYKWLEQFKNDLPITVYDENSFRGYVYIKDIVDITIDLLMGEGRIEYVEHEEFNIGGSEKIYLKDILKVFSKELGLLDENSIEREKEDILRQVADISKAQLILNYNPKPQFIENLQNIITKFKKENL